MIHIVHFASARIKPLEVRSDFSFSWKSAICTSLPSHREVAKESQRPVAVVAEVLHTAMHCLVLLSGKSSAELLYETELVAARSGLVLVADHTENHSFANQKKLFFV